MHVLIFGTFDDLHPGHHSYIEQALALGDVTAIVARDANVERIKGRLPLHDEQKRMEAIKKNFPQVRVVPGDEKDFLSAIRREEPDILFFGYDQRLPPGITEKDLPCPVKRAEPFEPHIHKSSIRRKNMEESV